MFILLQLLLLFSVFQRLLVVSVSEEYSRRDLHEILICRKCGADVVNSFYILSTISPGVQKTRKQNLFGKQNVTIQTLKNPFGVTFDIITVEKAQCDSVGPEHSAESWFPGYGWKLCVCPHCGHHLGWTFQRKSTSENELFHGLILDNVLGENFTNSLIMMPNMYRA